MTCKESECFALCCLHFNYVVTKNGFLKLKIFRAKFAFSYMSTWKFKWHEKKILLRTRSGSSGVGAVFSKLLGTVNWIDQNGLSLPFFIAYACFCESTVNWSTWLCRKQLGNCCFREMDVIALLMDTSKTTVVCAPVGLLYNYDLFCVSMLIVVFVLIYIVT